MTLVSLSKTRTTMSFGWDITFRFRVLSYARERTRGAVIAKGKGVCPGVPGLIGDRQQIAPHHLVLPCKPLL